MATRQKKHHALKLAFENKIEALLKRMTLEEKLGQMSQRLDDSPALTADLRSGRIGSLLYVVGAEQCNKYQKIAVEESRLGIPLLFGRDVIHGYRTILPIPLGQACGFDPDLVETGAAMAAREARADGINWTFAPMVDVARDPRWGRIAEGFGEDPRLTSIMAAAMVRGFQGEKPGDSDRVAACVKHYVGYSAAEGGRDYNTTEISERTLREVYLPPFYAAARTGAASFMSAFNDLNGIPATANRFTLTDILRGEWEFDGIVLSDWNAITELITHGFARDASAAAACAVTAGVDMEMRTTSYVDHLPELIRQKKVSLKLIDQAVRRILRAKFLLGLFAQPFADSSRTASVLLCDDHRRQARKTAQKSLVLLRNEKAVLPLSKSIGSLAVIGPLADDGHNQLGCWVLDSNPKDSMTFLAAIRAKVSPKTLVRYRRGVSDCRSLDTRGIAAAVRAARESDVVVVVVGEDRNMSGEARSRSSIELPGAQQQLVEALARAGKPLVVVLMTGRPLAIPSIAQHCDGLLLAFHPGTEGGNAIADVIFGDVSPSGRLPVSFPRSTGQIPVYYNHKNTGRPPRDRGRPLDAGAPQPGAGDCTGYIDQSTKPLYPFGFGLTYTQFKYSNLKIKPIKSNGRRAICVSIDLKNAGKYPGTELVQVYLRDIQASTTRPIRELRAFRHVELDAGKTCRVAFELPPDDLALYDLAMRRVIEPGEFSVWVGPDCETGQEGRFEITGSKPIPVPHFCA